MQCGQGNEGEMSQHRAILLFNFRDTNSNDAKMHMNAFCINMETWEVVENDALLSFQDYSYDVDLMDKWCE